MAKPNGKRRVGRPTSQKAQFDLPQDISRKEQIILASATLFARKGFEQTSIRDIAAATGMLSGSLYYHFASKEAIYIAVYEAGMDVLISSGEAAYASTENAWERLERIAVAHARTILENSDLMISIPAKFPVGLDSYREGLVALRDQYEHLVARAVAALDLPDDINQQLFRLQFLGSLNWTQTWFKPQLDMTAEEVARHMVLILRKGLAQRSPG